jgi:transposase-like protein
MASVLSAPHFQDETAAYAKLESLVWPNGPVCPHCGSTDRMKLMGGNATRPGLYKCYACRKQSRVTVGTVFESSHIKLHIWLQAAYLMCSSKKGISSNQLARVLGMTVKSAWFLSHRLREAMTAGTLPQWAAKASRWRLTRRLSARRKASRSVVAMPTSTPF